MRQNIGWRIWGLAAAFLSPFTLAGLVGFWFSPTESSGFIDPCGSSKYQLLWQCEWGGERSRLSEPLHQREARIWSGVMAEARKKNFSFRDPIVVQTTVEGDQIDPGPRDSHIYGVTAPSGRIMLSSRDMAEMTDQEVAILMGHELGHWVDLQSERVGHELFSHVRYSDRETVAWAFDAELYGGDAIERFRDRWQRRYLLF